MAYRDDRDALRAKNEVLAGELAEARVELERLRAPARVSVPPWWRRNGGRLPLLLAGLVVATVFCGSWLLHRPDFSSSLRRKGAVVAITRGAPATLGNRCELVITPTAGTHDCHVNLVCGNRLLYGGRGNGYTNCTVRHGRPVAAHDARGSADEGDPMLELDLAKRQVIVRDDAPHAYAVTVALDP